MINKEKVDRRFTLRLKESIFLKLEKLSKEECKSINLLLNEFIENGIKKGDN